MAMAEQSARTDNMPIPAALRKLESLLEGTLLQSEAYDRALRPISALQYLLRLGKPRYLRVARTCVVDRVPPYVAVEVSTAWIGLNTCPAGHTPMVFETRIFAHTAASQPLALVNEGWRHPDEQEARGFHDSAVQAIAHLMSDPVTLPLRWSGKRRNAKPYKGMPARQRRAAQRDFVSGSSGTRRIRGRGGDPDRTVTWTWDAEVGMYEVTVLADPALAPVSGASITRRSRRR